MLTFLWSTCGVYFHERCLNYTLIILLAFIWLIRCLPVTNDVNNCLILNVILQRLVSQIHFSSFCYVMGFMHEWTDRQIGGRIGGISRFFEIPTRVLCLAWIIRSMYYTWMYFHKIYVKDVIGRTCMDEDDWIKLVFFRELFCIVYMAIMGSTYIQVINVLQ